MDDTCQRCGEPGEDRRTLWMACFYAMDEMKEVPFKEYLRKGGTLHGRTGSREWCLPGSGGPSHLLPEYADNGTAARDQAFYTLRVCKGCRADWMGAIKEWFTAPPEVRTGCGSGIFVRENGAIKEKEVSREDWEQRRHGSKRNEEAREGKEGG